MIDCIELTSHRLRIRQFSSGDLAACSDFRRRVFLMDEDAESARRWLNWTIDSYRELAGLRQPPYADYAVERRDTGEFVGEVGIVPTVVPWGALQGDKSDDLLNPEVGLFWGVLPEHRRLGYATEAASALLDFLFARLRLRRVVATTEHNNLASQRVMNKLGMQRRKNPLDAPVWCQVVGVLENEQWRAHNEESPQGQLVT
ncbi:MAG: GNAT family N-acetyltransferase [Chloroflexi bacterium]|nr:GNAT family N-acetyltransferase [Chloroflexota bacterium]